MLYSPQLYRKLHQPLGYLPHPIVPSSPLRLMFACAVCNSQEQTPVFNIPNDELPRLGIPVILNHPSIALFAQVSILSLLWSRPTKPLQSTHHTPKYLTSDISYQTSFSAIGGYTFPSLTICGSHWRWRISISACTCAKLHRCPACRSKYERWWERKSQLTTQRSDSGTESMTPGTWFPQPHQEDFSA